MKKKVVITSSKHQKNLENYRKKYVRAAEGDLDDFDMDDADVDGVLDAIDDVADNVDDLQDAIDSIDEDDLDIAMNNNIANHYIAECGKCYGVFISAVVESDQKIEYVSGQCPICHKDTEQYLKWVIKEVD